MRTLEGTKDAKQVYKNNKYLKPHVLVLLMLLIFSFVSSHLSNLVKNEKVKTI